MEPGRPLGRQLWTFRQQGTAMLMKIRRGDGCKMWPEGGLQGTGRECGWGRGTKGGSQPPRGVTGG